MPVFTIHDSIATTAENVKFVRNIVFVTLGIEFFGAALLSIVFIKDYGVAKGIWFAIFHSVSAFSR